LATDPASLGRLTPEISIPKWLVSDAHKFYSIVEDDPMEDSAIETDAIEQDPQRTSPVQLLLAFLHMRSSLRR